MIGGKSKTEANYRALMLDSSSSLKDFSMDRKKYFKKYILGEKVEDKDNQAATMGRIVETLLLEPEEFDNRFYLSSCVSAPTGMMADFVHHLYKLTEEATDDFGNISRTFEDISREAHTASGYKHRYETVIQKFIGSDAEIYYNEVRKVKSQNLTVISAVDQSIAEKIVENLKTNPVTQDIVNLVNSTRYTILNQLQIEGYEVNDVKFKSMLDKVIIDHDQKKIYIYDLKCTWSVENFLEEYYLYRRAYIQAYLYWKAVQSLAQKENEEFFGYQVVLPKFIVCDSTNYYNPLIYATTEQDLIDAYKGFEKRGRKYPGVKDIIEDLKWATENNIWNISRENYLSNGVVKISDL